MSGIKVTISISIRESEDALLFSLLSWQICNYVSNTNLLNAANWSSIHLFFLNSKPGTKN